MKKMLALLFAGSMLLSLCACGEQKAPETAEDTTVAVTAEAETSATEGTLAQVLLDDFKTKMASDTAYTANEMANALLENDSIPFGPAAMDVEPGFLNGFTEEITGFSEGTMFGPMIGSIPFIGYIFTLEDGADVNAFMQTLKDKSDLRWNICTQADEKVCENVGNTVFFAMSPLSFEE